MGSPPISFFHFPLRLPWYLPPGPGNQRNAKRCKGDPIGVGQSATLDKLLELVGKGDAHVQTVADIARAVTLDSSNSVHSGLQKLAGCGANGKQDGNTERDFQRLVRGSNGFFLEPYNIKLTLQVWQSTWTDVFSFSSDSLLVPNFQPKGPNPIFHCRDSLLWSSAQVERDEDPQEVEAAVLLPHEVFGALHSMGQSKAG